MVVEAELDKRVVVAHVVAGSSPVDHPWRESGWMRGLFRKQVRVLSGRWGFESLSLRWSRRSIWKITRLSAGRLRVQVPSRPLAGWGSLAVPAGLISQRSQVRILPLLSRG